MGGLTEDRAEILTTARIARALAVSRPTVARWVDDGLLPGFKHPGSPIRRVHRADLVTFMLAGGRFRSLGVATVEESGRPYEARIADRWGEVVARVAPAGSPPGSGEDWRPDDLPRYTIRAASDDAYRVLLAAGFHFRDGRPAAPPTIGPDPVTTPTGP